MSWQGESERDVLEELGRRGYPSSPETVRAAAASAGVNLRLAMDDYDLKEIIQALGPKRKAPGGDGWTTALETAYKESVRRCVSLSETVQEIRRWLFGSPDPPFSSLQETAAWIQAQPHQDVPSWPRHEGEAMAHLPIWDSQDVASTPLSKAPPIVPGKDSPLELLHHCADYLAVELQCTQSQATAHIFTGLVPLVAPVEIKPEARGGLTIKVSYPWVQSHVVAKAYQRAHKLLAQSSVLRRHQPSPRGAELVAFVDAHRDKNWDEIFRTWNKEHESRRYGHLRYLQRAYYRARKVMTR